MTQATECLLHKHKGLSSNASVAKIIIIIIITTIIIRFGDRLVVWGKGKVECRVSILNYKMTIMLNNTN
jgi:hypothetical protein